jgi:hypothetical protein
MTNRRKWCRPASGCRLEKMENVLRVKTNMTDYDSPWKEALEHYFPAFLALFFPHIHADIDWSRGHVFLDKELQKLVPKAATGRLHLDKLVQLWQKDGHETWVLIHVEVQTQRDPDFPKRMYGYNTRITDRYNRTVVSLAVLADDDPRWRPDHYQQERWGWSARMDWQPLKLLDYANRVAELEASTNPFAKVVLAHLKALETRRDPAARGTWKFRLVRGLYERGFGNEDVRQLFRVIDWLMELPPVLKQQFEHELNEYEEGRIMPYVTSYERSVMLRALKTAVRAKFGDEGLVLMPALEELDDAEKYEQLHVTIIKARTLAEVRRACSKALAALRRKRAAEAKRDSSPT